MTSSTPRRADTARSLERAVLDCICQFGGLDPGEVITHFDLVVQTRRVDEDCIEHSTRHHWTSAGADPHMSYATLSAAAGQILRRLTESC